MPTKMISKALLGTVAACAMAAPAFAGGNCQGASCAPAVHVLPSYGPDFGPMTVRNMQPMQHLRSVNFQRAPNVSITREHGMHSTAALSDAPSGFTGGCHPSSTTYCRADAGIPVDVQLAPAPMPAPVMAPAPVVMAPSEPRVVRIGGGYDPSKFTPRVYGDPTFVPGIAHVPTSIVDRSPANAQAVLDSGRTVTQPVLGRDTFGGTAPHMGMVRQQPMMAAPMMPAPVMQAPMMRAPMMAPQFSQPRFGQAGAPMLQNSGPMAGTYGSSVGTDGSYWEKVSGPTFMGDTLASEVICKRQLPTRVVNPVVGVPVPVPTPVPTGCAVPSVKAAGRYGKAAPGRWIH